MRTKRWVLIGAVLGLAVVSAGVAAAAGTPGTGRPAPTQAMVQECLLMHEQMAQMHQTMGGRHMNGQNMAGHMNGQNMAGHMNGQNMAGHM